MNDNDPTAPVSNIAVLRGTVTTEPLTRDLPAGGRVVQFDVTTTVTADGRDRNVSVPVAWNEPTAAELELVTHDTEVVVVGTVRRRFFRVGGATQSRTEVVADKVIPARRRRQVASALTGVADRVVATPLR